jgi:metal-responsive CopG/Arc/MetJ family transcriptional regulator
MKHHLGLTIDSKLFREIEQLRGREKRSTFIEHLIRLGLKTYKIERQPTTNTENSKASHIENSILDIT